jgi:hypothetical protein
VRKLIHQPPTLTVCESREIEARQKRIMRYQANIDSLLAELASLGPAAPKGALIAYPAGKKAQLRIPIGQYPNGRERMRCRKATQADLLEWDTMAYSRDRRVDVAIEIELINTILRRYTNA